MLTVKDMGSGQVSYYTGLAREDYYTKGQEPPGVWLGQGAEKLELTGTVKEGELKNVFRGFSPDGKTPLVQNAGKMDGKLSRDPGWDLTFSAPKSVSIVWAVSGEQMRAQIEKAHFEAIRAVTRDIEEKTVIRKGKGGKEREQAGLVIAAFQHSTSRAVDKNTLPDMQLHTHTLVLNLGVSPTDGKTRSITSRQLYQNEKNWGAAYRAELSKNLQVIGFEIERARDSFEISGVPKSLISEFSKRTGQIEEQTKGITDPKEIEKKKLAGRRVKDAYSRDELFSSWSSECKKFGFTEEKIRELSNSKLETRSVEHEKREAVKAAVSHLAETKPTFTSDELQRTVFVEAQARGIGFREAMRATQDYLKTHLGRTEKRTTPVGNEDTRELSNYRHELEQQGYKVLGITFSRRGAVEFEQTTGIKSGSVREAKNVLNRDKSQEDAHERKVKRKTEIKYAIHRISGKTRARILNKFQEPTSEFEHNIKYATHQITKKHRDYLNAELRRQRFNVDEKTIVIVRANEKNLESYTAAHSLIVNLKKQGATIYTTEEILKVRAARHQQEAQSQNQDQSLAYSLSQQR